MRSGYIVPTLVTGRVQVGLMSTAGGLWMRFVVLIAFPRLTYAYLNTFYVDVILIKIT